MLKHVIFLGILFVSSYLYMTERTITHGPGVVAPSEPVQQQAFGIKDIKHNGFKVKPLAEFNIEARVLSKARYHDKLAEFAPLDLVVGWGPMSDEKNLNEILIKQSERYYDWQITHQPIPLHKMVQKSANIHLAPSTPEIEKKIWDIRKGHIVKLKGYLVEASTQDGWSLKSSLKRDDYGKDGSELMWVKEIEIK
ncbi:hypothetical protein NC796_07645 [Aliifodinibius sp. S!AR15-10]|uniref:hypothetical protein n=1 Tax=Aliifodinibius sp. S!AR15-10 TaxID=2950437 RepID=UPI002862AF1F|nr:hypothetical protein [Aliifodinibius sp. S!AR15-10]MDR8391005.1 hypothetical protein [Aliifodinibius sp. S!AR15-10]